MDPSSKKSGYTLLFAVLTAALVLGVAAFILGIARKQYILSSTARNSMYSIYASDSGIECAAEAFVNKTLATSSPPSIPCNGPPRASSWTPNPPSLDPSFGLTHDVYQTSNPIDIALPNGSCVLITVTQGYNGSGTYHTFIDSYGYNTCITTAGILGPDIASPRIVERLLELDYF